MAHGERYIDDSYGDEAGWMYFDDNTGEPPYGWQFLISEVDVKWVCYHDQSDRMLKGWHTIQGVAREFDPVSGVYVFRGSEPRRGL